MAPSGFGWVRTGMNGVKGWGGYKAALPSLGLRSLKAPLLPSPPQASPDSPCRGHPGQAIGKATFPQGCQRNRQAGRVGTRLCLLSPLPTERIRDLGGACAHRRRQVGLNGLCCCGEENGGNPFHGMNNKCLLQCRHIPQGLGCSSVPG